MALQICQRRPLGILSLSFYRLAYFGRKILRTTFNKVVDNLKLRASVGALGNQITNGYHDYMSILSGKVLTNYMMDGKNGQCVEYTFFA